MPQTDPTQLPHSVATPRTGRSFRKIVALSAAASVLGVGAITTLATWNDSEWLFGGAGEGDAPIPSGTFEIWQNRLADSLTVLPVAGDGEATTGWEDQPTSPGGALNFTVDAPQLSPGTTLYAPFTLQSKAGSGAGTVLLQSATNTDPAAATNDPTNLLWGEVRVSAQVTSSTPGSREYCNASFTGTTVLSDVPLATAATAAQTIAADRGNVQYYCFAISLPSAGDLTVPDPNDLQGRAIRPTWELLATSLA